MKTEVEKVYKYEISMNLENLRYIICQFAILEHSKIGFNFCDPEHEGLSSKVLLG